VELRTAGFAALSLQEIGGGQEEQTAEAVTEASSLEANRWRGPIARFHIEELERGGTTL
jgi:hypothetical protein